MLSQKSQSRLATRKTLISIVLVINAFVWYYFISELLKDIVGTLVIDQLTTIAIWSAHYGGIVFSALAGFLIAKKIKNRTGFLIVWMILGTISSIASIVVDLTYIPNIIAIALFWGISLGLGMPCVMGYFTESVETGNRGRVGGIMLLLTGIGMVVLGIIGGENIALRTFILSAWKIFGLAFLLIFRKTNENVVKPQDTTSYRAVLNQRSFLLYLVPWIMFSLITYLTTPIQDAIIGTSTVALLIVVENAIIAISGVIGGFFLDIFGRKRMSIVGFVLLGLGYSVLGLGDTANMLSWYFYIIVDGVAWGILFVIFVVTIWGDLSYSKPSDKYYAIGVLPFFISKFLQLTIGNQLAAEIPASSIFSLTALFLFLAVLPLFYAPETLPEKVMKDRELKGYVENAKKKVQKESDKMQKKEKKQINAKEEKMQEPGDSKEYEDAVKLAEKYY
jgi:MFS family permease